MVFLAVMPDTGLTVLAFVLLALLFLSFILSGAEVSIFSLKYKEINLMKTKQRPRDRRLLDLLESPRLLMATLSVGNIVVNMLIIVIGNHIVDALAAETDMGVLPLLGIKILSFTVFLLVFGEMVPRIWASQQHIRFSFYASGTVSAVFTLFRSLSARLLRFSSGIDRALGVDEGRGNALQELDQAIELSTSGQASQEERNMLKGIAKFGNTTVRQIMRSRLDVHGIHEQATFEELVGRVEELHYSRLPVYRESLDKITGIIHTKDLIPHLSQPSDFHWQTLLRQPYFVHENKLIEDLLQEFQSKRIHFAVVVDEFGGTEGIVTLEDILEEVIGDIRDEFDDDEVRFTRVDDRTFVFDGTVPIGEACIFMGQPESTFASVQGGSETMAGLVMELAGEIPGKDLEIRSGDFLFKVMELEKNRIRKIGVSIDAVP